MARPTKKVDPEKVMRAAQLGCTNEEIAYFCDCSVDTLSRRYAEDIRKGKAMLRIRLRQLQLRSAEAGSVIMQIFLGKILLHQREDDRDPEQIPTVQFIVHTPVGQIPPPDGDVP